MPRLIGGRMELTNEIAPLGGFRNVSDKRVDVKAVPQKRPLGVRDRRPRCRARGHFWPPSNVCLAASIEAA